MSDHLWCLETNLLVQHPGQDNEKSAIMGNAEPYQTGYQKIGDLYRACLKQHGRCIGYQMVDVEGKSIPVGWVFRRRPTKSEFLVYGNGEDHVLLETWVEVFTEPPKRVWTPGIHAKIG